MSQKNKQPTFKLIGDKTRFEIGRFVFAKVKGYSPWPAKVTGLHPGYKKCDVYYYGTDQTGTINITDLFDYAANKDQNITVKGFQKKSFDKAILEIELAIADPSQDLARISDTKARSINNGSTIKDEKSGNVKINIEKNSSSQSKKIIATTEKYEKRILQKRELQKTEKLKQSPKRLRKESPTEIVIKDENETVKPEEELPVPEELKIIFATDTLEYILMPDNRVVGINYGYNLPKSPLAETEHSDWMIKEYQHISMLKQQLENGEMNVDDIMKNDQLILNPDISHETLINLQIEYRQRNASELLKNQIKLLKLAQVITLFLLDPYKQSKFITELAKYSDFTVTPLIMKKNNECIEKIKLLQNYKSTEYNDNNSIKIQSIAKELCNKFMTIYGIEDVDKFWATLQQDSIAFYGKVKKYSTVFVQNMVKEPEDLDEIDIEYLSRCEKKYETLALKSK